MYNIFMTIEHYALSFYMRSYLESTATLTTELSFKNIKRVMPKYY